MDKILLIIQREFLSRVKKKSFLIVTLLVPLLFPAIMGGMIYFAYQQDKNAEQKTIDNTLHYHYNKGKVFLDIDFEKFLNILSTGSIQFDIRIGVHKSGKNYGKPHDHGSGFRIKKESLFNLFKTEITL